jgi:hypothetical protein
MKGFKIEINNKKIDAAVNRGVIVVTVDKRIGITGIDSAAGLSIDWGHDVLDINDKIRITASDIVACSPPVCMKPVDRQELLAEYHRLKKMLIEEGVLK